jgi:hypothetical protein
MIHRIGEMDLIPEGISVEQNGPASESDYVAIHCRVGRERVRLRAYRPAPGHPIEWDVETVTPIPYLHAESTLNVLPTNYFSDDPAPVWDARP